MTAASTAQGRPGIKTLLIITCLFAAFVDLSVMRVHAHLSGSLVPVDFMTFREDAMIASRHLSTVDYFPYPPSFLMLSVPFSYLPTVLGWLLWSIAGLAAVILAARRIGLEISAIALGLASPPSLFCLTMGQSGMIVSAALLLALGLADTQPIIAGIAAGSVAVKPQFGLLLPICFLASRNWRAIFAAAITVLLFCAVPSLAFGMRVWHMFFTQHVSGVNALLTQTWPQGYQLTHITIFMLFRSMGLSLHLAEAIQAAASAAAAAACWRLWQRGGKFASRSRLAATLCLIPLATPYADIYDQVALAIALASIAISSKWTQATAFAVLCTFTCAYGFIAVKWGLPGAIFLGVILYAVWPKPSLLPSAAP